MRTTKKILKKAISVFLIFMILINYSYPAIVCADDSNWSYNFDANRGGDYKDKKYADISTSEPTLNQVRGDIAYEGVIMQAYVINQLLISGELKYTTAMQRNPDFGKTPGAPQYISNGTYNLDSTVQGKTTTDIIKEKINALNKGSAVVRDYATSKLDENLEELKSLIKLETPPCLYWDDAKTLAKEKEKAINPNDGRGGQSASDVVEQIEEDRKQEATEPKDKSDKADLGGILLSPIFYLINFIADAITESLGAIMAPSGDTDGFSVGIGVLKKEETFPEVTVEGKEKKYKDVEVDTTSFGLSVQYPNITYTPEEIFAGEIDLLSINFITGENNSNTGWNNIRRVIAQWYNVLRMVAIIGLLSVLIYTGIKIIISANAKDKAKYKEWIGNWFMAVAILFFMHVIMAFIISVTGEFSKLLGEAFQEIKIIDTVNNKESVTNLMGLIRFMIQSENFYMKIGYEVMYIALIVYTIKFTIVYLKRVLSMAFLTLIAPIVALTYPIDKINDGRSQGFDMWIKEYIFNALLQPMHQILYYILVGSAVGIAASNPIYGIVVLAFMTEAEKLLKKIFGFDKAGGGTVGGMANAFAAGAIASSISKMAKLPKGNASRGGAGGSGGDDKALDAPKPISRPGMDTFDDEPQGSVEERMQEADDEKFRTDEYDSAEREANLRNENTPIPGSMYDGMSDEEAREFMRDNQGMDDETIALAMAQRNGGQSGSTSGGNQQDSQSNGDSGQSGQQGDQPNGDSGQTVRQMAAAQEAQRQQRNEDKPKNKEGSKFAKGAKAVTKKIMKPVWDADKSKSYNFKRLGKGALKGTAKAIGGFSLGVTAAAIQAGISITDGKYNPMEGIGSLSAGAVGAGRFVDRVGGGIGSIIDTYREGTLPDDSKKRKEVIMRRARDRFGDRDDVIAFNKKNYPGQEEAAMKRQRDNYLVAGITDLKEMKSGMRYADALVGKTAGLTDAEIKQKRDAADKKAAATIDFRKTLKDQGQLGAVYDADKRAKYIKSVVDKAEAEAKANNKTFDRAKMERQYNNAFKSVVAFDAANA